MLFFIFEKKFFLLNLPVTCRALTFKPEKLANQNSNIRQMELFPTLFLVLHIRPSFVFAQPLSLGLKLYTQVLSTESNVDILDMSPFWHVIKNVLAFSY